MTDDTLYVTDAELIRRLGVGEKTARVAISELERRSGFPKKDKLFGDKRYWPAVRAFLDRRSGVSIGTPMIIEGKETAPNGTARDRERTRNRLATAGQDRHPQKT